MNGEGTVTWNDDGHTGRMRRPSMEWVEHSRRAWIARSVTDWLDIVEGEEEVRAEHFVHEVEMHEYLSELEVEFRTHHQDELSED